MKILLATPLYPPEIGGPATYAKLLEQKLPQYGYTIDILSFSTVKKFPSGIRHLVFFFKAISRARSCDIVFAQDVFSVGFPALLAAKVLGKPFVVRVPGDFAWEQSRVAYGNTDTIEEFQGKQHTGKISFYKRIERWIVRSAKLVMTPSHYFSNIVSTWGSTVKPVTVYNGINKDEIDVVARQKKTEQFSIISAGRMVPWKEFDALIETVSKHPAWTLTLVGTGPEKHKLEALARERGISDRVTFTGAMEQRELWKTIAQHHVFILNSSFESFSYQVVEAMALQVPVIATTGCNLEEIITDGVNGVLIPPRDVSALEVALQKLQSEHGLAEAIAKKGEERSQDFSIEKTIQALVKLLRSVLEPKKVIFFGTDSRAFISGSSTQKRLVSYGTLANEVVFIIATKGKSHTRLTIENTTFIPTRSLHKLFYPFSFIMIAIREKRRGAILSPQDPSFLGLIALFVSWITAMKLYVQVHTDIASPHFGITFTRRVERMIARIVLRRADKVRVVSKMVARHVAPYTKAPVTVLPIFVQHTSVVPHNPSGTFTYLVLSRLEREKNISGIIDTFNMVHSKYPDIRLIIAGSGSEKEALERRVDMIGNTAVEFVGWIEDPLTILQKTDVFLQNSWFEGYGLALVEALQATVPVVTTNVGIAQEVVIDGVNSFLCPVGDSTCFQQSLLQMYEGKASEFRTYLQHHPIQPAYVDNEAYLQALQSFYE